MDTKEEIIRNSIFLKPEMKEFLIQVLQENSDETKIRKIDHLCNDITQKEKVFYEYLHALKQEALTGVQDFLHEMPSKKTLAQDIENNENSNDDPDAILHLL